MENLVSAGRMLGYRLRGRLGSRATHSETCPDRVQNGQGSVLKGHNFDFRHAVRFFENRR